MRLPFTGGNGRLGSWVGRDLRNAGHAVVSVDRALPGGPEPGITYRADELGDLGQLVGALAGCEAVLHFGAIPAPWSHPAEVVFRDNVGATYNVLQAAMTLGIRRAIIASSASAYGMTWARPTFAPLYAPLDEDHPLLAHDPYALSKEVDERTAEMFARRCGMTVLAYRFQMLPQRRDWIAMPGEVTARALGTGPARADADATTMWACADIHDRARACRLGLAADLAGLHAFNTAAADTLSPEPTEDLLRRELPDVERRAPLPGRASAWSVAKAARLLGYTPRHSWRDEA